MNDRQWLAIKVLAIVSAIAFVIAFTALLIQIVDPQPFAPLRDHGILIDGPIEAGSTPMLTLAYCSDHETTLPVTVTAQLRSTETGRVTPRDTISTSREPGCHVQQIAVPTPLDVAVGEYTWEFTVTATDPTSGRTQRLDYGSAPFTVIAPG